jgi:glyoxylate reductase
LQDILESKKIYGAGLDVTHPEPLDLDDPIFKLDNIIITPHIGGADSRSLPNMAMLTARNVHAALNGKKIPSAANP